MPTVVSIDPSTKWLTAIVSHDNGATADVYRHLISGEGMHGSAYLWLVELLAPLDDAYVFLEEPIAWRGNKSTLTLAAVSGALRAACDVSQVPVQLVNNQSWKSQVCQVPFQMKTEEAKPFIAAWVQEHWPELYEIAMEFGSNHKDGTVTPNYDICDAGCMSILGWDRVRRSKKIRRANALRKRGKKRGRK